MTGSRKKVVFVLPFLYPGGAERALVLLMNNIDREKFAPEMVTLKGGGALESRIDPEIPFHSLGDLAVKNAFFSLKKKLKELEPDVVVTTMVHSNFLLLLMKPFFPKVKFIVREAIVPGFILSKHRNKAFIIKALYRVLYPLADKVISPSQEIIDEFESLVRLKTSNHVVLYNQVDEDAISKSLSEVYFPGSTPGMLRFVCAGRLVHQKGYDRLIRGLKNFAPYYPWRLVFLGDGEDADMLKKLASECGIDDHVEFKGDVENPWSIIAAADRFLLPSRFEGMPNVVLESLFCGTPVIASAEANGVREIKKGADEVSVTIAEDMVQFVKIMGEVVPAEKGKAGSSLLAGSFTKGAVVGEFEEIICT